MGRMARAFAASCNGNASVHAATRVHETHGERDTQRLFNRHNLRLKVPTSMLHVPGDGAHEPVDIPYLKLTDFFRLLVSEHPELLFGGLKGQEAEGLCELFWDRYEKFHGEHVIFRDLSKEERRRTLPIALHGDKGRGRQKAPVFCFSWQTVFALPKAVRQRACKNAARNQQRKVYGGRLHWSCAERAKACCNSARPETLPKEEDCSMRQPKTALFEAMEHNGRGNSLLSRYLVGVIPKKVLSSNAAIVPCLLSELAEELKSLLAEGVQDRNGATFRVCLIGCKGDYEFLHLDAGQFNRTYLSEGRVNCLKMCPECHAGEQQYPATDMADIPRWTQSLYKDDPWSSDLEPPLCKAPYADTNRVSLYRKDPFHTLKYGFCRDLVGSCLFLLSWLGYFDTDEAGVSKAIDARLARAFGYFRLWCAAESKVPTIKSFTPQNLHRTKASKFPWLGGKGSDTVLCMMFLHFFLTTCRRDLRDPAHEQLLLGIQETLEGGLDFLGILHSHGIWLPLECARYLHRSGLKLLRGYHFCADYSIRHGYKLFSLRPKCHYYAHMLWELHLQISADNEYVLSPGAWNCENDEDWIGKLSRLSRRVSPKTCSQRCIDRYLIGVKLLLNRAGV